MIFLTIILQIPIVFFSFHLLGVQSDTILALTLSLILNIFFISIHVCSDVRRSWWRAFWGQSSVARHHNNSFVLQRAFLSRAVFLFSCVCMRVRLIFIYILSFCLHSFDYLFVLIQYLGVYITFFFLYITRGDC